MNKILESSKYLILISVISTLITSLITFILGIYKTVKILISVVTENIDNKINVHSLQLMDTFLIAIVLLIFSTGLYGLFIKEINVNSSLKTSSLYELETKLGNLIILVMAMYILEKFIEWENPANFLYMSVSFLLVSGTIIVNNYFINKDKKDDH